MLVFVNNSSNGTPATNSIFNFHSAMRHPIFRCCGVGENIEFLCLPALLKCYCATIASATKLLYTLENSNVVQHCCWANRRRIFDFGALFSLRSFHTIKSSFPSTIEVKCNFIDTVMLFFVVFLHFVGLFRHFVGTSFGNCEWFLMSGLLTLVDSCSFVFCWQSQGA